MSNKTMYTCLLGNTFFIASQISFASFIRATVAGVRFKDTGFGTGAYLSLNQFKKLMIQKQYDVGFFSARVFIVVPCTSFIVFQNHQL